MSDIRQYESVFKPKGLGGWRGIYIDFINALKPNSIIEFGAGDPTFLITLDQKNEVRIQVPEYL